MGSLSNYAENKLLDHTLEVAAYTRPTTVYLALSTTDPDDSTGNVTEPVGNGYAREACAMSAAASRAISNSGTITFTQATGAWGTISHWALFDALSGGNMLAHGSLSESEAVVSGNTPSFAAGEIEVSFNAGVVCNNWANSLLDFMFRNQALAQPDVRLGFSTANPGDDESGLAEPSGANYSRLDGVAFDAASGGASANTGVATFATPSGSWGLITHAFIANGAAGDVLIYGTATPNQTPLSGATVRYNAGEFDVTLS